LHFFDDKWLNYIYLWPGFLSNRFCCIVYGMMPAQLCAARIPAANAPQLMGQGHQVGSQIDFFVFKPQFVADVVSMKFNGPI
jgi:hypothetical protein